MSLSQVIHYELPNNSEIFVHRSGRTGRAGKKGAAILIYTHDQNRAVRFIERDVGCKFTEVTVFLFIWFCCSYLFGAFSVYYLLKAGTEINSLDECVYKRSPC